jgi:hypothetical protein
MQRRPDQQRRRILAPSNRREARALASHPVLQVSRHRINSRRVRCVWTLGRINNAHAMRDTRKHAQARRITAGLVRTAIDGGGELRTYCLCGTASTAISGLLRVTCSEHARPCVCACTTAATCSIRGLASCQSAHSGLGGGEHENVRAVRCTHGQAPRRRRHPQMDAHCWHAGARAQTVHAHRCLCTAQVRTNKATRPLLILVGLANRRDRGVLGGRRILGSRSLGRPARISKADWQRALDGSWRGACRRFGRCSWLPKRLPM